MPRRPRSIGKSFVSAAGLVAVAMNPRFAQGRVKMQTHVDNSKRSKHVRNGIQSLSNTLANMCLTGNKLQNPRQDARQSHYQIQAQPVQAQPPLQNQSLPQPHLVNVTLPGVFTFNETATPRGLQSSRAVSKTSIRVGETNYSPLASTSSRTQRHFAPSGNLHRDTMDAALAFGNVD